MDRLPGDPKVIKCRRSDAGRTHLESRHIKSKKVIAKSSAEAELSAAALGPSEAKGSRA